MMPEPTMHADIRFAPAHGSNTASQKQELARLSPTQPIYTPEISSSVNQRLFEQILNLDRLQMDSVTERETSAQPPNLQ